MELRIIHFPSISIGPIKGDGGQLEQVLMNLAINAQHAMPDGGTLSIETIEVELDETFLETHPEFAPGRYALLTVRDTGTGMPPEIKEHIFEPFFTTRDIESGTGLGLATVYGIIKQHEGYIYVESELEAGTTFSIYLPISTDAAFAKEPAPKQQVSEGKGETILVVEDDEIVRRLACIVLERSGYRIIECGYPHEAIEVISKYEGSLDMVLTDVVMPKMNGRQLYEEICKTHPDVKVIFMSGYTSNVIAHRGVIDEGLEFIHKPFTISTLTAKIRDVLDK